MLSQTVIINIDFSLFRSAVFSPHGDYGAQQLMNGCMDRWCVCSPLNCRLCLSYVYITQVWFSSSITECKALWDELKEVPSFSLFAVVAHMHAFAWDSNCTRTG